MFIRSQKEFDKQVKASDQCHQCGQRFLVPSVIVAYDHPSHLECAKQLAYSILSSLTGEPDMHPRSLGPSHVENQPMLRQ